MLTVLVLALLGQACAHRPGPSPVELDYLWVSLEPPQGGLGHGTVRAEPSETPGLRVAVFEESAGSTGPAWRSTLWLAAWMGTVLADRYSEGWRISFEGERGTRRVEGPSAGAVFAVSIAAAIRGDHLRPDSVMTGTLLPDGGVGPVDGILQKFRAAARQGRSRLGYPAGQSRVLDLETRTWVKLADDPALQGVELVELADLHDAYAFLTGARLPRLPPLASELMVLGEPSSRLFRAKASRMLTEAQALAGALTAPALPERLAQTFARARTAGQGRDAGLAYFTAGEALGAALAERDLETLTQLATSEQWARGLGLARQLLAGCEAKLDEITAGASGLQACDGATLVELAEAMEPMLGALGSIERVVHGGGPLLSHLEKGTVPKGTQAELASLAGDLREVVLKLESASLLLGVARDQLAAADPSLRGAQVCVPGRWDQEVFRSLAESNLEYFESVFLGPQAARDGRGLETLRQELMDADPDFRRARFNLVVPSNEEIWRGRSSVIREAARLGGALSSQFASSALVMQRMAPGLDQPGSAAALTARARTNALRWAAVARKDLGRVPIPAVLDFSLGDQESSLPGPQARQRALEHFWRSSGWSLAAVALGRSQHYSALPRPGK
jgi:hypothetical protein